MPSSAIAFDLKERRVGRLMKKMCPNKRMNCIGKYRRNLINMDETLTYFYFEKLVFLVELIFMSISREWEEVLGAEAIFWIFNSIVFAQSVIQTILQGLLLRHSIALLENLMEKTRMTKKSQDFMSQSQECWSLEDQNIRLWKSAGWQEQGQGGAEG